MNIQRDIGPCIKVCDEPDTANISIQPLPRHDLQQETQQLHVIPAFELPSLYPHLKMVYWGH